MSQRPAAPRAPVTAEEAQLDQRIELAAKKAALRSLEAQEGGPATGISVPPGMEARVVIEKDGKTIVLENPTAEQLRQIGVTGPQQPDAQVIAALTGGVLVTIVLLVWMTLSHLRKGRGSQTPRQDAEMANRIARIENVIESVAVEVERISEGQRFTSRILSEGAAIPFAVPARGEAVPRDNGAT